jgi:hypothetical protein
MPMREVRRSPHDSLSLRERVGVRAGGAGTADGICKAAPLTLTLSHREREQGGGN